MDFSVLQKILYDLTKDFISDVVVAVIIAALSYLWFFVRRPAFVITLDVVSVDKRLFVDDSLLIEPPNNTFSIELNYSVRSIHQIRKIAKWAGLTKLKISLSLGVTREDRVIFSTKDSSSEILSIDVINATSFTKKLTCQYRLESDVDNTEVVPVVEAVYNSKSHRLLAEHLLLRHTISWRGYKKLFLSSRRSNKNT